MIRAFLLGLRDGWKQPSLSSGLTFDDDPNSARSNAYDRGVNTAQRVRWGGVG